MSTDLQPTTAPIVATAGELVPVAMPADQNPALVYLASLAPGSRRTMEHALDVIAELITGGRLDRVAMPWGALRYQHTQKIRRDLAERYAPATVNKMLSALRGVLRDAWRLGYMSAEEYQTAIDLKPAQGERPDQAAGRALSGGEWRALIEACIADESAAGVRDAAILGVLRVAGLRRAEVAALTLGSYDRNRQILTVKGKRNKTRAIPIEDPGALGALADWFHVRGLRRGPLFTQIRKGGHVTGEGLTDQAIYYILEQRREAAGVEPFTPHDLRRSFAGDLLDEGVDLATVQKMMGHSSPTTTAGYDRRGERAKRKAATKIHLPYTRRYQNGGNS